MKKLIPFVLLTILIGCKAPAPIYVPIESTHYVLNTERDTIVEVKLDPSNQSVKIRDTSSTLKNKYCKSTATWDGKYLHHSLNTIDTAIPLKTKIIHVSTIDSIQVPYPIKGDAVLVEKDLTWWQLTRLWMSNIMIIAAIVYVIVKTKIITKLFRLLRP